MPDRCFRYPTDGIGTYVRYDTEKTVINLGLANPESPLRLYRVVDIESNLRHLRPDGTEFEQDHRPSHTLKRDN